MKQFNIFGGIDKTDGEGNIIERGKICEICERPSSSDLCSEECSKMWSDRFPDDFLKCHGSDKCEEE